jgi:hypothetical protein
VVQWYFSRVETNEALTDALSGGREHVEEWRRCSEMEPSSAYIGWAVIDAAELSLVK